MHVSDCVIRSHKTADLSKTEYAALVEKVRDLYLWFAPESTEQDIYDRFHRHPETYVDVLWGNDSVLGFSAYQTEPFDGANVMFRGGTIVRERSRGLYKQLLAHGIHRDRPDFLVAMTQNPRVYEALRSFSPAIQAYPLPAGESPPEKIRRIATHFCKAPGLNPVSFVVPDVYGSIRKDDSFRTGRDPGVRGMFAERLQENDGLMVVVPL